LFFNQLGIDWENLGNIDAPYEVEGAGRVLLLLLFFIIFHGGLIIF